MCHVLLEADQQFSGAGAEIVNPFLARFHQRWMSSNCCVSRLRVGGLVGSSVLSSFAPGSRDVDGVAINMLHMRYRKTSDVKEKISVFRRCLP